jgi:ribosomal protein L11 methyltransferase
VIRLAIRVPGEQAEEVLAELLDLTPAGVEEVALGDGRIEFAVYGPPGELPALPDLQALAGEAAIDVSTSEIADDWQERWRDFHRPVLVAASGGQGDRRAGNRAPTIRVRPPWEPAQADPVERTLELVIDPGQAFGTGGHASTRLCLQLLLELLNAGDCPVAALDVGTGSGVLAIAAARLGIGTVLALDNELESVAAAAANATANDVELQTMHWDLRREPLPWIGPDAEQSAPCPAGTLVLANLLRPLLIELCGAIERPPAALIAGGLLREELDEIAGAFAAEHRLLERARRCEGEWGALWLAAAPADSA